MEGQTETIVVARSPSTSGSVTCERVVTTGSRRSRYVSRACLECRKRKVKCSGHQPGPCHKCALAQKECVYGTGRKRRRQGSSAAKGNVQHTAPPQTLDGHGPGQDPRLSATPSANGMLDAEQTATPASSCSDVPMQMDVMARIRRLEDALAASRPQEPHVQHSQLWQSSEPGTAHSSPAVATGGTSRRLGEQAHAQDARIATHIPGVSIHTSGSANNSSLPQYHDQDQALDLWPQQATVTEINQLKSALERFFEYNHVFYFCLNETQVFAQLEDYASWKGRHTPSEQAIEFIALAKLILASMSILEDHCADASSLPGWEYYCHACDLLTRRTAGSGQGGLLRVQCFIIQTAYLIAAEEYNAAYESIGKAVQLCFQNQLHNQSSWQDQSPFEVHMRQRVLYSVYAIDKSISLLCGVPYLMRGRDINVDLPAPLDDRLLGASEEVPPETPQSSLCSFIPGSVQYARLVSVVWDEILSSNAPRPADRELIATLDARILYLREALPSFLQLAPDSYTAQDPTVPPFVKDQAMALHLFTNNLRLVLRREDVSGMQLSDAQCRLGANIAHESLEILHNFCRSARCLSLHRYLCVTYLTGALVCLATIVLRDRAPTDMRRHAALGADKALGLLQEIAPGLAAARRALQKLTRSPGLRETINMLLGRQHMPEGSGVPHQIHILPSRTPPASQSFQEELPSAPWSDTGHLDSVGDDSLIRLLYTPAFDVTAWDTFIDET